MASTHLLVSSSPAPAHQLHRPFCYFEPQPSPLSRSNNGLFRNNSLSSFHQDLISDDYLENLDNNLEDLVESEDLNSEQYEREDVQSIIEDEDGLEDKESTESGHDDDDEYFEEEDLVNVIDTASQNPSPSKAGFSPTLDASFASSMSFGTAPPTPSIIKKPQNTRSNVATSTSSFLPAHLFEPNPNAMPPSSSPHRMDISPALGRRFLIPSQSNPSNLAIPHSPDDPFGCPSHPPSQVIWTNSPINSETRRTIGLRKANSRPLILSDSLISNTSRGPSNKSASTTDGMDIDSPSYAHHDNQKHSLSSDDQPSSELQFSQRSTRSASQSSTGKRSRPEEDEECQESSHSSSSGNLSHHSQTSPLHSSSPKQIALQVPRRSASNLFAPSQDGFSPSPYSLSPYNSSSPYPIISPSVKAAAKMTLGRKSGQRSLSGFSFPATKGLGPFNSNNSTSSRSHQYGMGSLGASSNACPTRRPALGVVQSSAALFSRYQQSNSNLNRPRDATGRPPSKSRRAISFAATQTDPKTSSLLLQSGLEVEEDDEDEELDVSLAFNCSPAPRTSTINFSEHPLVSNTWPKYTSSPNPNSPLVIDSPDQSKQPRKRSPPPPALGSLAPPLLSNSMKLLQSPTANLVTNIGFNIESPVGMGFSEKERAGKILPCHKVSNDGLMRILPETMDRLLEGAFDENISKRIVIDCRFGYEYEGGHIRDAINIREKEIVEAMLLKGTMFKGGQDDVPKPSESGKVDSTGQKKKMVIVFHCEYSAMRAPTVAKYLREKDRHLNMPHYPALHYPEIYILEGGYAKYYSHSPQHCEGSYVKMDDPIYRVDRQTDLNQFRNRESAVFSRAKSFTYGEARKMSKGTGQIKKNILLTSYNRSLGKNADVFFNPNESKENRSGNHQILEEEEDEVDLDILNQSKLKMKSLVFNQDVNKKSNPTQCRSLSMIVDCEPEGLMMMVKKQHQSAALGETGSLNRMN